MGFCKNCSVTRNGNFCSQCGLQLVQSSPEAEPVREFCADCGNHEVFAEEPDRGLVCGGCGCSRTYLGQGS